MLVFIDESGDPGLKIESGSSKYFVVALVMFDDNQIANDCDQRIQLLKKELGYDDTFTFHFTENSDHIRRAFLQAVAPYNFTYFGFVLNKDPEKLWGDGFKNKESLYKCTCNYVFNLAKPYLINAHVVIDKSGTKVFGAGLAKYLKTKINADGHFINKVKLQRDRSNNLLQLADYVAGVINRYQQGKKFANEYHRYIAHKEMQVQVWPK